MSRTDLKFSRILGAVAAAIALGVLAGATAVLVFALITGIKDEPRVVTTHVMLCPEDAVIVGRGEYTGGVGWDTYECVPLDDLTKEGK